MSNPFFKFKQFIVYHDKCAMKVGTDGVLLGCWTPLPDYCNHILDIGTGSGLLSLMLAQRCPNALIDAIDIEPTAIEQAKDNFTHSPWQNRIRTFNKALQDWKNSDGYDLIISNPPYFQNSLKNPNKEREMARHTDTLPFEELFLHSANLLKEGGLLSIILPAESEETVRHLAHHNGLKLARVTRVYSKENKPARRVLLCWTKKQEPLPYTENQFVLEASQGGRSLQYQELTKDFYL